VPKQTWLVSLSVNHLTVFDSQCDDVVKTNVVGIIHLL